MNFVEELKWRGMIHDIMPGTEEFLLKEKTAGYIGFDPTSDSLHIGSLVQIMILVHFQRAGHQPYALIGGATGMVGDPSGKSQERNLLNQEDLQRNIEGVQKQLSKFLDFEAENNSAQLVNNYDWFKSYNFLDFIRDVGKHMTVNYMMAKDSVKKRMETGISFTEFSYQLVQGYDFYWLYKNKNCKVQLGGSDQWGNIVTGTELIRRMDGGSAFAITSPLVQKADGTKFGKTETGNIWLDAEKTSPYKFYQYWINSSDVDAENYIKIFTLFSKAEIEELVKEHRENPGARLLQNTIAKDLTCRIHGEDQYTAAMEASKLLFQKGEAAVQSLNKISSKLFDEIFEGVPQKIISKEIIAQGMSIVDALVEKGGFLKSNGEARRALKENSISLNKEKVDQDKIIDEKDLIAGQYLLLQRGKKNYFVIKVN
ncbi:MAG: tyrosine--tRNA ligase [Flavobacteriales bacterium]|nr:tyrosine--tRNA ligase [Flavobacteriales bacterium]